MLLFIFSFGCTDLPIMNYEDDVIVKVLKDMLIAEGAVTRVSVAERDSLSRLYYDQIYKIHEVDSLKFTNDLKTLGENPKHSILIYSRIEKEMENDQMTAKQEKSK